MVTRIPARMIETTGVTPGSYSAADITVNSAGQVTSASTSSVASSGGGPKITSIVVTDSSYTNTDDTAVGLSGGYIKVTGTGFSTGCSVIIGTVVATSVSFINSTEVRAQVPAQSAGTYTVYLVNSDGGVGIRVNGLNYSSTPTWTTTSPLGDGAIDSAISIQLAATSNSTVTYALEAGSTLPAGLSLSSSGLLSGTVTGITVDTTYNFTVVATDAENQDTPQAFSITITVSDPNFKNTVLLLQADTAPTIISDASTNNFDLSVAGDARASSFTPYGTGWSYYFPAGAYLTTSTLGNTLGTGDFCMECWVYSNSYATNYAGHIIITCSAQTIFLQTSGSALRFLDFTSPTSNFVIGGGSVVNGRWHHIVGTRQSGTVRGFIDGKLVATQSSMNFNYGTVTNIQVSGTIDSHIAGAKVTIGSVPAAYQTSSTTLNSNIFAVPTGYVSSEANTLLLTAQTNRFINQVNNTSFATISGSPKIVSFNPFGITNTGVNGSMYFDGTGDYCAVAANSAFSLGTGAFTIEGWVYTSSTPSDAGFFTNGGAATGSLGFYFLTGYLRFDVYNGGGFAATTLLPLNQWVHIACVRSGNTVTLYQNGTSVGSSTITDNNTSSLCYVGTKGWDLSKVFNGYISNFRLVKGTAVYTANFTPPTQPLTAIANTSLLTLQYDQPHNNHTFLDSSSNQFLITRNGNTTQGTFSPFSQSGHSVYFDGTGDYLAIADNAALRLGTGDFTIEFYINVGPVGSHKNQSGGVDNYPRVISKGLYGSTTGIDIGYGSTGGKSIYWSDKIGTDAVEPNTWYHVAFTRSGTTWRVFKDGVLNGSATIAGYDISDTGEVHIARLAYSSGGFGNMNCYISNLRIVKGTALYTTNFTPSTTPLTSVANTSLLACHANRFIDGSANNFTVTRNGDAKITAFGPFSTTAYSATSNGGSAYFDGTGDDLVLPINTAFALGTDNFTIEAWIYPTQTSCSVFTMSASGVNQFVFTNNINAATGGSSNGTAQLWMSTGGGSGIFGPTNAVIQNAWNHIAAVRQSGTVTVYVNGIAGTGVSNTTNVTGVYTPKIGSLWSHSASVTPACYISALRIVKGTAVYTGNFTPPTAPPTATTNTSLLLNFTDAAIRDSRGLAVLETVGDAKTSTVQVKYGTGSMYFDGNGDYVKVVDTLPFAFGANNFTVEFWMNATTSTNPGRIINYWATSTATAASWQFLTGGTTLFFGCGTAGTSNEVNISGTISLNTWTHIAGVRNGNVFTLYINGTQAATTTQAITLQTANTVTIGGRNSGGTYVEFFAGYLDDLRITRGIARYTENFTPPAAKFLAR